MLKRIIKTLGDLLTSKKALAAVAGIVAQALGASSEIVALIGAYILGQGVADHGKERAKIEAAP